MRYFLLDRITKIELGRYIEGYKCWTMSEEYFEQHFPGSPIVPGVLLIEGMAQLLGYLINLSYKKQYGTPGYAILSLIHKAKFASFVRPGDRTVFKAYLDLLDNARAKGKVKVFVENKRVADAELNFFISNEELQEPYRSKIYEYYDIITKDLNLSDDVR